MEDLSVDEVIC